MEKKKRPKLKEMQRGRRFDLLCGSSRPAREEDVHFPMLEMQNPILTVFSPLRLVALARHCGDARNVDIP